MWPFDMETGRSVPVSRSKDPAAWFGYADADVPVVTQWDDGQHTGTEPGTVATSSASMPSVVFRMLRDLDVQPGNRTLEIGTGTGWNAALLAHRLGAENVVTVEVDEAVATRARTALRHFELPVRIIHGDGLKGYPEGGPYDRIIATCGVRSIPVAWIEQSRPGEAIVVPWGTHYSNDDAVARLVVSENGADATGAFTGPVAFMKARAQRLVPVTHSEYVTDSAADREKSSTPITETEFLGERFSAQRFALGLSLRHCVHVVAEKRDGARPVWFFGLGDRSWACVKFQDGQAHSQVWQSGPRRLWDEVTATLDWWREAGEPGHERFGLTLTPEGTHRAWLDDPTDSWAV
ncbi:methyltransferase domain-containing protein [Streptomyces cinnabarinus]|uniref:methyltransferase domain-containing protein n=1 Tax=Streptomyces cinnabarinus TaxID=67287 RepID=UPI00300DF516